MSSTIRFIPVVVLAVFVLTPVSIGRATSGEQEASGVQSAAFVGSDLFRTYCATCHGTGAKGDGPLAEMLKVRPADLTRLAARNNGVFDAAMVARIVDGREPVKGHGGKDMPVWGDAFRQATGGSDEASIKARIDALVRHLQTIQVK